MRYYWLYIYIYIIKGSFELKLPTIWTDEKAEVGRVREEKRRRKKIKKRKGQKKEYEGAGKGRKVAKHCVCPMFCGSGGSKSTSRLPKAVGAEPSGEMRDEQLHAVVARSTFPNQNGKTCSDMIGPLFRPSTSPHCTTTTATTREHRLEAGVGFHNCVLGD